MTWWAALCGCPYYEELYLFYIIDNLWEISEFTKCLLPLSGFFSSTPCPVPQFHLLLISFLCCLPHSAQSFSWLQNGPQSWLHFSEPCYNMDKLQNAKWMKLNAIHQILFNSCIWNVWKRQIDRYRKSQITGWDW